MHGGRRLRLVILPLAIAFAHSDGKRGFGYCERWLNECFAWVRGEKIEWIVRYIRISDKHEI